MGLASAPTNASHPHQKTCVTLLGFLERGWPKSATIPPPHPKKFMPISLKQLGVCKLGVFKASLISPNRHRVPILVAQRQRLYFNNHKIKSYFQ